MASRRWRWSSILRPPFLSPVGLWRVHGAQEVIDDMTAPNSNHASILRRRDLERRIRLSRSTIYDKINPASPRYDPNFPKPIRLGAGAAVGWLEHEVDEWLAAQIASRRTA